MAVTQVRVPDIGDFDEVEIIEVLVKLGDTLKDEDPLITVESDKASMDIPTNITGTLVELNVKNGDKVSKDSLIGSIETSQSDTNKQTQQSTPTDSNADNGDQKDEPSSPLALSISDGKSEPPSYLNEANKAAYASPSIRRQARLDGVDLSAVKGTGNKGRITKEDLAQPAQANLTTSSTSPTSNMGIPTIPSQDFAKFGEIEITPLTRIQKISGPHLHRAWLNVPMVTHHDEADTTELEEFRQAIKGQAEKKGIRVTSLSFIMKALAHAMEEFPIVNSSLSSDGESLILKKYINIGIAVDTPKGLIVPVFKDIDKKSIYTISKELGEISKKARQGKLSPTDLQGGCISISSLGGIGGTAFTPLVNAPEVAILGVTRAKMQPVWNSKEFIPRLMLPLDLTYDHRVIDGAVAARFMTYLCQCLSDIKQLLL